MKKILLILVLAVCCGKGFAHERDIYPTDNRRSYRPETGLPGADHGALGGLGDDDHTQYLLANGGRALGGNWSLGGFNLTNGGAITATTFVGALTGNASTATLASTVTVVDSTDATSFIAMFNSATGSLAVKTDGGLLYDATTGDGVIGGSWEVGDYLDVTNDADIGGNLTLPKTTSTVGQIIQVDPILNAAVFHTFTPSDQVPPDRNLFAGWLSGSNIANMTNVANATHATGNVGLGPLTLDALTTGFFNLGVGARSLSSVTIGGSNIGIGHQTGQNIAEGSDNLLFGRTSGNAIVNSNGNTAMGNLALFSTDGDENTAVGRRAMFEAGAAIDRCIALGAYAGEDEDASDRLIIDNRDRGSAATTRTNAIIYGIMAAAPGNQTLTINATTNINGDINTDRIYAGNGSTGLPSYSNTGDTNTGMWFSAADTINLSTAGVERLEIDSLEATFTVPVSAPEYRGTSDIHLRSDTNKITFGVNDEASIGIGETSDGDPAWVFCLDPINSVEGRMAIQAPNVVRIETFSEVGIQSPEFAYTHIHQVSGDWLQENVLNMNGEGVEFFQSRELGPTFTIFNDQAAAGFFFNSATSNTTLLGGDITFDTTTLAAVYPGGGTHVIGTLDVGVDPNKLEVSAAGVVNFVEGAGLQFGEISYHDGGFNVVLAAQDTDYQVVGFNADGESNGDVTPDQTNDHITVGEAGRYLISYSASIRSAASNVYDFEVKYNNGTTGLANSCTHRSTTVANKLGVIATTFIADLPASATIEMWVSRADGGAVAKTITIEQINLNVLQIAGSP